MLCLAPAAYPSESVASGQPSSSSEVFSCISSSPELALHVFRSGESSVVLDNSMPQHLHEKTVTAILQSSTISQLCPLTTHSKCPSCPRLYSGALAGMRSVSRVGGYISHWHVPSRPCTWIRVVFSLRQSIYPCWPYVRSSRSSIQITKNRCTFTPSISDTCRLSAWAYLPDDENEKISLPTSRRGNHLPAVIVTFANRALCAKQGRRLGIRCCHMVLCSIRSISRNEWISKPINSTRQH